MVSPNGALSDVATAVKNPTATSTPAPPAPSYAMPASARSAVADRLADALDRRGVSDELLEAMQEQETMSLKRIAAAQTGDAAEQELRHQLLYFTHGLLHQANAREQCWFEAARVVDLAGPWPGKKTAGKTEGGAGGPSKPPPEALLARAAAVCSVAEAIEGLSGSRPGLRRLVPGLVTSASQISASLGGRTVSMESVMCEQCNLLPALDSAPNVARWVSVFLARFDVATGGACAGMLEALESLADQLAARLIVKAPRTAPRHLAVGCFAAALASMGVVPPGTLRPEGVDEHLWQHRISSLHMLVPSPVEPQAVTVPRGAVLAALQLATQVEASTIRMHALAAVGGCH